MKIKTTSLQEKALELASNLRGLDIETLAQEAFNQGCMQFVTEFQRQRYEIFQSEENITKENLDEVVLAKAQEKRQIMEAEKLEEERIEKERLGVEEFSEVSKTDVELSLGEVSSNK